MNTRYVYNNTHPLHTWEGQLGIRASKDFTLVWTESMYHLRINKNKPVADFRLFAGFFPVNNSLLSRYNMRMDGQRGYHDYTYDNIFIGRNESTGLWSGQFMATYGAFKAPTALGQSNKWLASLNVSVRLPIPVIKLFADAGLSDPGTGAEFLSDAGVYLDMGALQVFFPLYICKPMADEYEANGFKFGHRIRFTLNLNQLNPLKLVREPFDKI